MNGWPLLGIILIAYAVFVAWVAWKKPKAVWEMAKIRLFRKWIGERGTVILFYGIGLVALGFGIWLMTVRPG